MKHVLIYLFVILLCSPALAATNAIDPQVVDALERLAQTYENLQGWQLEVMSQFQSTYGTNSSYRTNNIEWAFQRPIKTRLVYDGSRHRLVTCDGVKTIAYEDNKHRYIVGDAPASWHVRSDNEANSYVRSALSTSPLLLSMVSTNMPSDLLEGVLEAHCINTQTVNETACLQLQFRQEKFTWDLWIRTEKPHLIKRCTAYSNEPIGIEGRPKYTFRSEETWHHQELNPTWPDDFFVFTPPTNATLVETFRKPRKKRPDPPHPLLGKAAPDATITRLDESTVDLDSLYTNGPVVLDFWATWCGPCRAALPKLEKVAARWQTNGITVMAINSAEDPATISTYLDENPLKLDMARDDETLADLFEVESIPHTVIIDTNGIIQYVHTGFSYTLEDELSEILTQVMTGEPVAQNILDNWQERVARGEVEEPPEVYKAQPIPSGTNAITTRDWRERYYAFHHQQFMEFYLKTRTTTNGEEQILAFLNDYERDRSGFEDPEFTTRNFIERAEALLEQGYDHPIIYYCLGCKRREWHNKKDRKASIKAFHQCIDALEGPDYANPWLAYNALWFNLWNYHNTKQKDDPAFEEQQEKLYAMIPRVFSDPTFSNETYRIAVQAAKRMVVDDAVDIISTNRLYEVLDAHQTNMIPAVYHYMKARLAYSAGWDIRGGTYAYKVPKEAWPLFRAKIDEAREHAEASWKDYPTPEVAHQLIGIARSRCAGDNEWRMWFDRGVAIQMDYMPLYGNLAYTLYPRWHGNHRLMQKLADECLATQRYDTQVPHKYEEIIKLISYDSDDPTVIFRKPGVYSNLVHYYKRRIQDSEDKDHVKNLQSRESHAARFAGQYDDARRILQDINYDVTRDSCLYYHTTRNDHIRTVLVNCSDGAAVFTNSTNPLKENHDSDPGPAIRKLLETEDFTEREREIITGYADLADMRADWQNGSRELYLPNDAGIGPWYTEKGEWYAPATNMLAARHNDENRMFLPIKLGNAFEMTGDLELKPAKSSAYICFGHTTSVRYWYFYLTFNRSERLVRLKYRGKTYEKKHVPLTQLNGFRIKIVNHKLSLWVNGDPVFDECDVPAKWIGSYPEKCWMHLGFYTYWSHYPDAEMALYNLHLRNLSEEEGDASSE